MLVRFVKNWFAPSSVVKPSALQSVSGKRFSKGTHEISDEYFDVLPSSATVVSGGPKEVVPDPEPDPEPEVNPLHEADGARAAGDAEADVLAQVNRNATVFQAALDAEARAQAHADEEVTVAKEDADEETKEVVSRDTPPAKRTRKRAAKK